MQEFFFFLKYRSQRYIQKTTRGGYDVRRADASRQSVLFNTYKLVVVENDHAMTSLPLLRRQRPGGQAAGLLIGR